MSIFQIDRRSIANFDIRTLLYAVGINVIGVINLASAADESGIWKRRTVDRRRQRRVELTAKLSVEMVSPDGPVDDTPLRGKLINISQGGAAFLMKLSKCETARLLLGQELNINLLDNDGRPYTPLINRSGTVVAAQLHLLNEYLIHLCFDKRLSPRQMSLLEAHGDFED